MQLMVFQELVASGVHAVKGKQETVQQSGIPHTLMFFDNVAAKRSISFIEGKEANTINRLFNGARCTFVVHGSWNSRCYVPAQSKRMATSETDRCLFGLSYLMLQIYADIVYVDVTQNKQKLI